MQLLTTIAAMAATLATVNAQFAHINNYCDFEVYVWPTDGHRNPSSGTPIPPGSNWCEEYQTAGGGVALKITTAQNLDSITIMEYDLNNSLGPDLWTIWYDGSNINCETTNCPFWEHNLYIEASDPNCAAGPCPAKTVCRGFYQLPNDDYDSFSCPMSANTTMHLCLPDHLLPTSQYSVVLGPIQDSSPPEKVKSLASSSTSTSAASPTTTPPPVVQINEAIVETTITITTTTWLNRFGARHAHAHQHHGHA